MNDFWDARYSEPEYAYGLQPNEFFREQLKGLAPGRILFPAEGEGRNAVYAAQKGFDVSAFDSSVEGRRKALALAEKLGVTIDYRTGTYESVDYPTASFDALVLVFAHMPAPKRRDWHRRLAGFVRPGGHIVLEGFSKEQLRFSSGGPPSLEMLFSEEELASDFEGLQKVRMETCLVSLDEGIYHKGTASVVRAVFRK